MVITFVFIKTPTIMLNLAIPIPDSPGQQDIEIEMSMNGRRQRLRYRVEVIPWSECQTGAENRVDCIRDVVRQYDQDWVIYHIGTPTERYIPLTFINRTDWAAQLQWLWEI